MGTSENFLISWTSRKTSSCRHPDSNALWAASWFVNPSASGSEKGTPNSSKSTPFSINVLQICKDVSKFGSHAQTYPTKAALLFSLQFEKSFAIRSLVSISNNYAYSNLRSIWQMKRESKPFLYWWSYCIEYYILFFSFFFPHTILKEWLGGVDMAKISFTALVSGHPYPKRKTKKEFGFRQ